MAINEILGLSSAYFFEQHYLKTPFALAGACVRAMPLGTRSVVERILLQASADVLACGPDGAKRCELPFDGERINAALNAGESLAIRHAQLHDSELEKLTVDFEAHFLAPVDVHLYLTPAKCPGFGWHYDAEDVFILQTTGTKHWELRKNTVNPWPLLEAIPEDMQFEREIMPVMRCTLVAGDWLYIPNGYWHRAFASEESISLSIGIATRTGLDVFDYLREQLAHSLLWRQRLPPIVRTLSGAELGESEKQTHFDELAADLDRILKDPSTRTAFIAQSTSKRLAVTE